MNKYFGTSIDVVTGEEKTVYLTPEEIAALPPPPTLEQRNAAIKAQRIAAFADLITGSDGMFIKAMATGEEKHLLAAQKRRQEIITQYPDEVV